VRYAPCIPLFVFSPLYFLLLSCSIAASRQLTEVGVEPTKSPGSRPGRFAGICVLGLCNSRHLRVPLVRFNIHPPEHRTAHGVCLLESRKLQVRGSHPAGKGYEPSLDTGPPAILWFRLMFPHTAEDSLPNPRESRVERRPQETGLGATPP
jgi:hypothetical protein